MTGIDQPQRGTPTDGAWSAPSGTPVPPAPLTSNQSDQGATAPGVGGLDGLVAGVKKAISDIDRRLSSAELPFDTVRSGLEWWYRPIIEARTWIALGYLFVGAIWAPVLLALAAAVFFPTFALVLGLIGLLLVVPAFAWFNVLAGIERRRAGWVGEPVPVPQFVESSGGLFSSIRARLVDTARWRQLLFFALFVIVGPVLFALGSAPWGFVIGSIFDDVNVEIGLFGVGGLGSFLGALAFAGAAPRITLGAAWLAHAFTTALLGPTERAELQERVTELSDQRQQILDAVAGERRRIERNLHDGVQQQLVALGIDIGRANARIDSDPDGARQLLDEARDKVRGSIGELRLIGRGLHPAVLEDRGLDAALSAVVANAPIPITVEITCQATLAEDVASTAYYVANEAVANILKHSHARVASIRLADEVLADGSPAVRLRVHDDGRGGADIGAGSGLAGIRARVDGVDGQFHLSSPTGGPTTLEVVLPLDGGRRE